MPKVSVLTPIYKTNIQYLREMIESVLDQTYKDFEFLILNDSPDCSGLDEVVVEYQKKDSRIRYIKNHENIGISNSRNILLKESQGEYLAILDHDDICSPERFRKQVEYLDANQSVGVVGTWVRILGKGSPLHFPEKNMDIKRAMMYECVISHSSAMIRKSVMERNKIHWESEYSPSEDYMLWARLFSHTLFHNIQEELLKWRVYEDSSGSRMCNLMADKSELVRSYLRREYPSFYRRDRWLFLCNLIPLIKIHSHGSSDVRFLLFGKIPIAMIK